MLSASRNGGRSWSAPVRVGRSTTSVFPWVSAGDAGRIAVSYYATSAAGKSPEAVPASARWQVHSAFSTDYGRTFADYRTTGTMQHGSICTSGTNCATGTRNLLDFFETAVDPAGCLVTTYTDNSSGNPIVSYVRQTAGPGLLSRRSCR
jgi:methionine synthase I (cobalamin-dependent)